MKQTKSYFSKNYAFAIILIFSLAWMPFQSEAQSVKRQCISSYGASGTADGVYYGQTAGQPYHTQTHSAENMATLPGFQQPAVFAVEEAIGPDMAAQSLDINVFPNPAVHSITLESSDIVENATVQVMDINGKTILSEKIAQLQNHTINCTGWTSGVYFINVLDGSQKQNSYKLIINK